MVVSPLALVGGRFVPIGFEMATPPASVQMRPQFLREGRQNRNVAVRPFLAVAEMNLRRVAVQMQVFNPDVDELINPRPTEEERFNHEPVLAVRLICVLDQPLHLYLVQPVDCAAARARWLQYQPFLRRCVPA